MVNSNSSPSVSELNYLRVETKTIDSSVSMHTRVILRLSPLKRNLRVKSCSLLLFKCLLKYVENDAL